MFLSETKLLDCTKWMQTRTPKLYIYSMWRHFSHKIKLNNESVNEKRVNNTEFKISQFEDDSPTSFLLVGTEKSLENALEILSNFDM